MLTVVMVMEAALGTRYDRAGDVSRDYLGLVDKVNDKLRTLRSDLISMRRQDVKLLKQLVNINDVIQAMYQRAKEIRNEEAKDTDDTNVVQTTEVRVWRESTRRTPLVRQQSVPYYCGARRTYTVGSIGSSTDELEDVAPDDDTDCLFSSSGSGLTVPTCPRNYIRQRAISCEATSEEQNTLDDSHFEDMLMKNIQLWKFSLDHVSDNEPTVLPVR